MRRASPERSQALERLLAEQRAYYRAIAPEYGQSAIPDVAESALEAAGAGYRTDEELVEGPRSSTIRRTVGDGTAYRLVKVPHAPAGLEQRLRRLGWDIAVRSTSGPFYWGEGCRARPDGQ